MKMLRAYIAFELSALFITPGSIWLDIWLGVLLYGIFIRGLRGSRDLGYAVVASAAICIAICSVNIVYNVMKFDMWTPAQVVIVMR